MLERPQPFRLLHVLLPLMRLRVRPLALELRVRQPPPQNLDAALLPPVPVRPLPPPLPRPRPVEPRQLPQDAVPAPVARHPLQLVAHRVDLPPQLLLLGPLAAPPGLRPPLRLVVLLLLPIAAPRLLLGPRLGRGRPQLRQLVNRRLLQPLRPGLKPVRHLPRPLRPPLWPLKAVLLVLLVPTVVLPIQQTMQRVAHRIMKQSKVPHRWIEHPWPAAGTLPPAHTYAGRTTAAAPASDQTKPSAASRCTQAATATA